MKKKSVSGGSATVTNRRKPLTPEARENQMISLAVDLAEKQLIEGTASSQVITHFLKLATEKERLEKDKLKEENKLLKAKTESIQSQKKIEQMYAEALSAMKQYAGQDESCEFDD